MGSSKLPVHRMPAETVIVSAGIFAINGATRFGKSSLI